jgi:bifunctional DNA-binding transcriptional regulator/antitoxin component of YhaV-PrlF toxin-antitoxin module
VYPIGIVTLSESRVSKGYLTVVPKGIRRAVAIGEGDVLEWEVDDDRVVVRKRTRRTVSDITGMISHGGDAVQSKREAQGFRSRVH